MDFQVFWFLVIAFFWIGYFVLEGFDFGVGILLPFVGRNERDRHLMLETIGPVWDGNEVWLVIAAGATFAAFPTWYATMFSGFYLALLLVLVLLIVRVVSFEWRTKSDNPRWRSAWLGANVVASVGAPFIWGVALASLVRGVPLDSDGHFAGDFGDLFSAYTVFAGIAAVGLFAFHGAAFLTLRLHEPLRARAGGAARALSLPAAALGVALVGWTVWIAIDRNEKDLFPPVLPAAVAVAAFALAVLFVRSRREGWAFAATAVGIAAAVATIFTGLYPRVLVSSPNFANSLTIDNASSSHYALGVMTVAALILTPLILLYEGWTYYVFRARLKGEDVGERIDLAPRRT
jgi:cytochrome bd ubiquinol oxidase subunit II